jgi:hypothetical protein
LIKFLNNTFCILIILVLLDPRQAHANQGLNSKTRLYNAMSGLQFKAQNNALSPSLLKDFVSKNEASLKEHKLYDSFSGLISGLDKFSNCKTGNITLQLSNIFVSKIDLCNSKGQIDFLSIQNLANDISKITSDLDRSQGDLAGQMKALADEIYQAQRTMYIGTSYLAFNKYLKPGISVEDFMKEWTFDPLKHPKSEFDKPGKGLNESDKLWKVEVEKASAKILKESPSAQKNLEELVSTTNKQLLNIYNTNQVRQKAEKDERALNEQLLGGDFLLPVEKPEVNLDLLQARNDLAANSYTQPFLSIMGNRAFPAPQDSFFDLNGALEEVKKQEGVRQKNHLTFKNSPEFSYYVEMLRQKHQKEIIVIDDIQYAEGQKIHIVPTSKPSSPLNRFSSFGLPQETIRLYDNIAQDEIKIIQPKTNDAKIMVVPLSQITKMHTHVMQNDALKRPLTRLQTDYRSRSSQTFWSYRDSITELENSDGKFLPLGSQVSKQESSFLERMIGLGPTTVYTGDTRRIFADRGLRADEQLKVDEARTMLMQHLAQTSELMSRFDNMYQEAISDGDPENYVKDALYFHPSLVNQIIANKPEYAGALCAMARVKEEDLERQKRNDRIFALVSAIAAIALVVATLGAGLVAVVGVGGAIGTAAAATGTIASVVGLGSSLGSVAYNSARYNELQSEYETANNVFYGTGQVKGKSGAGANVELQNLYKEAQSRLDDAIIDGALAPLDVLDFYTITKGFTKADDFKKLGSTKEELVDVLKEENRVTSTDSLSDSNKLSEILKPQIPNTYVSSLDDNHPKVLEKLKEGGEYKEIKRLEDTYGSYFQDKKIAHSLVGDYPLNQGQEYILKLTGGLHTQEGLRILGEVHPEKVQDYIVYDNGVKLVEIPSGAMNGDAKKQLKKSLGLLQRSKDEIPLLKTIFPSSWSMEKVLDSMVKTAKEGKLIPMKDEGKLKKVLEIDGVRIEVVLDSSTGKIITGYPAHAQPGAISSTKNGQAAEDAIKLDPSRPPSTPTVSDGIDEVNLNASLNPEARRIKIKQELESLRGAPVSEAEVEAVMQAHSEVPTVVGQITPEQMRAKIEIMQKAGLPAKERDLMIRKGLAGMPNFSNAQGIVPFENYHMYARANGLKEGITEVAFDIGKKYAGDEAKVKVLKEQLEVASKEFSLVSQRLPHAKTDEEAEYLLNLNSVISAKYQYYKEMLEYADEATALASGKPERIAFWQARKNPIANPPLDISDYNKAPFHTADERILPELNRQGRRINNQYLRNTKELDGSEDFAIGLSDGNGFVFNLADRLAGEMNRPVLTYTQWSNPNVAKLFPDRMTGAGSLDLPYMREYFQNMVINAKKKGDRKLFHVNLDGGSSFVKIFASNPGEYHTSTEVYALLSDPELLARTNFYEKGKLLSAEEVQKRLAPYREKIESLQKKFPRKVTSEKSLSQPQTNSPKTTAHVENSINPEMLNSKLTEAEVNAIREYTYFEYYKLNKWLRGRSTTEADLNTDLLNNLTSGLNKLPNFEGQTLRGTQLPNQVLEDIINKGEFTDKAFFSSSTSVSSAFMPYEPRVSWTTVRFFIKSKTGKDIQKISARSGEAEVLFLPNTKFKIVSHNKSQPPDDAFEIYMEEV